MRMTWALGGAIAAAAVLALAGVRHSSSASMEQAPPTVPLPPTDVPSEPERETSEALQGEVLETLPVAKYTYLRLATSAGEIWAAVPSAAIALHSRVKIVDATRMDDFKSSTLKRTFDVIYFGTLARPGAGEPTRAAPAMELGPVSDDQPLPPGHPDIGSEDSAGSLPPGHPSLEGAAPFDAPAHPPTQLSGDSTHDESPLPDPPNQRASGKNAYLVAELVATRRSLVQRRVRVRGEVTKVTDVQDHAFFHIRDASVGADGQPADIAVTSASRPKRGDIATFEGVLRVDVDVGTGYSYPVLLENATLLAD